MELLTPGSLRAAQLVWRPAHGGFVLTVVCKATFALRPGVSPLAPSQQPVAITDTYEEGGALVVASDLVPLKKQPEVLLTGNAHAPRGERTTAFTARLVVGEIDKAIRVEGDRTFGLDGQLTDPAPFVRMPLAWQRAAGGPDTSNPAGRAIGTHAKQDAYGRVLAPNLLPAGLHLQSRSDILAPVGFGPIAPHWPLRARCLHRHVTGWDPARWSERPLPDDIDLAYFNAAPIDQRRAAPFGEEAILLENLHPLFGDLSTRLAPVTPIATIDSGQGSEALQLRCDTLLIDTQRGLAMLVWRGHAVIERPDQQGRIVVTHAEARESVAPPQAPAQRSAAPVFDATQEAEVHGEATSKLPFSESPKGSEEEGAAAWSSSSAASLHTEAAGGNALLSGETLPVDALFGGTMAFGFANATPAVPFGASRDSTPPREAPTGDPGAGLPFASAGAVVIPAGAPPIHAGAAGTPLHVFNTPGAPPPVFPSPAAAPVAFQAPAPPLASPAVSAAPLFSLVASPSPEPGLPPSPVTDSPVPPPPLGTTEPSASSRPPPQGEEGARTPAPEAPAESDFDSDIRAYPPARCGAIAARLDCNPTTTGDILRAEELDAERWERVHEHWQDHIDAEASRGRVGPRADYDAGYVAALESERLPITVEVYAKLAEAVERDALDEALLDLRFPEDAWLHIQRFWIPRRVADPTLGKQVRAAIAARRDAGV